MLDTDYGAAILDVTSKCEEVFLQRGWPDKKTPYEILERLAHVWNYGLEQRFVEVETALVRLNVAVEPVYRQMAYDEAKRRARTLPMGMPAAIESVYQDVVTGRWRPTAAEGP